MSVVPSVNPESVPVPADQEGQGEPFVDDVVRDGMQPLADDPDNLTELADVPETEDAPKPDTAGSGTESLTPEQLARIAESGSDDDDDEDEPDAEAEATSAENGEDAPGEGDEEEQADKSPRKRSDSSRRERQRRARARAQERERALQTKVDGLEQKIETLTGLLRGDPAADGRDQEESAPEPEPEQPQQPKMDDYDTIEEWAQAMSEYTDQSIRYHAAQRRVEERQTAENEEEKRRNEAHDAAVAQFQDREEAARDRYEDYDAVARAEDLPITEAMAAAIVWSEIGPDISYHLGMNPEEAARIAALPPIVAAREIGVIEARLQAAASNGAADPGESGTEAEEAEIDAEPDVETEPSPEPPPRRSPTTRAPAPFEPLQSGGAAGIKDPTRMSQPEYEQWRRSQGT